MFLQARCRQMQAGTRAVQHAEFHGPKPCCGVQVALLPRVVFSNLCRRFVAPAVLACSMGVRQHLVQVFADSHRLFFVAHNGRLWKKKSEIE